MASPTDRFGAHEDLHEFVAFEDPDEFRTWVFDLTFLTSPWTCIFGRGCPGIAEEPDEAASLGCCSHGAHFVDDDDHSTTKALIDRLTPEQWQFKSVAASKGGATRKDRSGAWVTRVHQGACILLNRPDHARGAGCALHTAALDHDERPLDWKPDVCWQVPLRLEEHTDEYGYVTSTLREWKRRDWGGGGSDFGWWCTDDADAFVGGVEAWQALRDEIVELTSPRAYELLADYLGARHDWTPVPHPVLRRR